MNSAYIGILYTNKNLKLIHCRHDGTPRNGAGVKLLKHFNSLEDAETIISQGNRSHLSIPGHKKEKSSFYNDPTYEFNNWDSFSEYIENKSNTHVYLWNEPVSRWECIIPPNHNLNNLVDLKFLV